LLLLWEGHIHTDAIFSVDVFLYIYKYLFKGPDTASFTFAHPDEPTDAIDDYIRARYISSCEAAWQIFSFHISHQYPSATRLAVHEEHANRPQFRRLGAPAPASTASTLIRYFNRPSHPLFDNILYTTFFESFRLIPYPTPPAAYPLEWWPETTALPNVPPRLIIHRSSRKTVTRIQVVRPGLGEVFYIRCLLFHRPARSFKQLRTINAVVYNTFQEAAQAARLFEQSNEGELAMEDAISQYRSPAQLRFLFVLLIQEGSPALPLWERFSNDLAQDYSGGQSHPASLPAKLATLRDIQRLLHEHGKSTTDFGLPAISMHSAEVQAELACTPSCYSPCYRSRQHCMHDS
jgi:hypothetical protein